MNFCPTSLIAINPNLLTQTVYGEAVIVSTNNAMITSLNPSGTFVFDLLQRGPRTVQALLEGLLAEFDIDASTAEADLQAFLTELQNTDLILASPHAAP